MTRYGTFAVALAASLICGAAATSSNTAAPVRDPRHVELLYSEDDALCKPLARLYDQLNHEYPRVRGWEDRYANQFRSIGLTQPKPLNDALHPLYPGYILQAFYRLKFQDDTLVYVKDVPTTGDNFATDVWIFKPWTDVVSGFFNYTPRGGVGEAFAPDRIDFAALFGSSASGSFKKIGLPYYFTKILSPDDVARVSEHTLKIKLTALDLPGLWPLAATRA